MQPPRPGEELPAASTRPKRQSHLPAYLRDYEVRAAGWEPIEPPPAPHAAQHTQGSEDWTPNVAAAEVGRRTVQASRSTSASPISQYAESTAEEWSPVGGRRSAATPTLENAWYPSRSSAQLIGPAGSNQTSPSAFYRPWEGPDQQEAQSVPHDGHVGLYRQSVSHSDKLQLSAYDDENVISFCQPPGGASHDPQPKSAWKSHAEPVLQPQPLRFRPPAPQGSHYPQGPGEHPTSAREQDLMDSINRMMRELQLIKDQAEGRVLRNPQVGQQYPGERPHHELPPPQYQPSDYFPQPSSFSQAYIQGYPHQPVPGWTPTRLAEPPSLATRKPSSAPSGPQVRYEPHPMVHVAPVHQPPAFLRERTYRGPVPTIPDFAKGDPSEFTHLKIALENLLPPDATELFCYQILLDHLKLEEARLVADAYLNSSTPYSDTMAALTDRFGQPHKLALKKIATVMNAPDIRRGDSQAFQKFALQVRALVGMLQTLGREGIAELQCGSHVERLLSKLPSDLRSEFRRCTFRRSGVGYNLTDFSDWLQYEAWCQDSESHASFQDPRPEGKRRSDQRHDTKNPRPATILHGVEVTPDQQPVEPPQSKPDPPGKKRNKHAYCPYCECEDHFLSQCDTFKSFDKAQVIQWIKSNRRCWRCGRAHQAAQCDLKKLCSKCQGKHLQILHEVNVRQARERSCLVSSATETLYLDRPAECSRVLLKVVRVLLHYENQTLDTYAVLDDGSERTMILTAAAHKLGLQGHPESLALRTIRQDVQTLDGASVTFRVSSTVQPNRTFQVKDAFTAERLSLADHTYPVAALKRRFKHLHDLPLQAFDKVRPMLLIGADNPHLITPVEPVRLGPPGGPAAIKTRLGWTLQGPARMAELQLSPQQCLFTSLSPREAELLRNVEKLWQLDLLPSSSEKQVTRSREDQQAIDLLESKTQRVEVHGTCRYATPLLRRKTFPSFQAPMEAVMPRLRSLEKRLLQDPTSAAAYEAEIAKLEAAGTVAKVVRPDISSSGESWYIPHHLVQHNGKNRVVFDCSFRYKGLSLNEYLLPGPALSPSLLGVLLRFREHCVGVSGDIKGMFHQVWLLPEDRPLLRFLWRNMRRENPPEVYEWRVLPFGTTCSPCCATYALQRHVFDYSKPGSTERFSIEKGFYVDNCLQSVPSTQEAIQLINNLRDLLQSGGFEIRQWASNVPGVISHLPAEARSEKLELWLTCDKLEARESTLGLCWQCDADTFSYKHRPITYDTVTMRNIYRVLASQYDPLGFLLPYTTRAKVLVQQLWDRRRDWDDPSLPAELLTAWRTWECELEHLPHIQLPRCYTPAEMDHAATRRDIHIFCDASEKAYGAVAYLRSEDPKGRICIAFLLARSRVAPRKQLSMPRLELCAAVTGAQLAKLLRNELTLEIRHCVLWSDSTTVLTWLHSESCRFKVFVGTRVAEIQELTDLQSWRYIDSPRNPADDLTKGKSLQHLGEPNRWSQGPKFLQLAPEEWPTLPLQHSSESGDTTELRRSAFCGLSSTTDPPSMDWSLFKTWKELMETLAQELHGAAGLSGPPTASTYQDAEFFAFQRAQQESFADDYDLLKAGKPVASNSRLLCLAPEFDTTRAVVRVGGRLRRGEGLDPAAVHPIVLDPSHPTTKLLIQEYDTKLCHPGPERVFAELRRRVWILRGREAVKRCQQVCVECRRWRSQPAVQRMADLPPPRLRLFKPAFYSCGIDCFGPLLAKVGRRTEKRWGILFKCLTTRAVHLEVLPSLDCDSFLMALRRFVARRGKPAELYSDQGTNFRGGERELRDTFSSLCPDLQQQLATQQIAFHFNPPAAPHFGGAWEREIRSVKSALYTTLGAQTVSDEVLRTILIEIESILNSKPLGYVSADVADVDPVTPNYLLMGRPDSSLPQVVYPQSELLGRRRWRHSQVLADRFWTAFVKNYLPGLQLRNKWRTTTPDMMVGAVVMVVDPQVPRSVWRIGKVVKVFPGPDGHVRTAEIQIEDKIYTRPITRLIILPKMPEEEVNGP
ncbi:uncharacterized protein LOC115796760 [Archocentrus centrarchus]|uniref:uncharacterized protein LOC115796760 n=1 Tax=Archocentrus centrarchus TaxID=63155 RepID=UPI0011EA350B|nr:uncharacterized protein LOC115796760 [Archocentrus centrarchus]XP_030609040.1 uncharacterized protein LOC115796760 [Archocentrus centrarchus]